MSCLVNVDPFPITDTSIAHEGTLDNKISNDQEGVEPIDGPINILWLINN